MEIQATKYDDKDIIRIMREWTGLTQKEFAKTINRSERSIQSLESGERHITLETFLQIAKKHNIKIVVKKDT